MSQASHPTCKIIRPGIQASVQDLGRTGWKKYGVPPGGAMDQVSALIANQLVGNHPGAPVLEILIGGTVVEMLRDSWVGLAGADVEASSGIENWSATLFKAGSILEFPKTMNGLWIYLAIPGGIASPRAFGSASTELRSGLGTTTKVGTIIESLQREPVPGFEQIARRRLAPEFRPKIPGTGPIRFFRGPQWQDFTLQDTDDFIQREWKISHQSNRVGYRLEGGPLISNMPEMLSEPALVGTIQIPPGGQPLVLMRDGPTLGGYPKLGVVHPGDLNRLAQMKPGSLIRFQLEPDSGPEL